MLHSNVLILATKPYKFPINPLLYTSLWIWKAAASKLSKYNKWLEEQKPVQHHTETALTLTTATTCWRLNCWSWPSHHTSVLYTTIQWVLLSMGARVHWKTFNRMVLPCGHYIISPICSRVTLALLCCSQYTSPWRHMMTLNSWTNYKGIVMVFFDKVAWIAGVNAQTLAHVKMLYSLLNA